MKDPIRDSIKDAALIILSITSILLFLVCMKVRIENNSTKPVQIGDRLVVEDITLFNEVKLVPEEQSIETSLPPQLIWNADDEGIPAVGGKIVVEQIEGNKFYLVPEGE